MTRPTPEPTVIRAYPDGPFLVRGDFVLEDTEEGEIPLRRSVIALCRCGRSRTAPLCDGSHRSRPRPQS
ncbi:MAG: CDGSH iron-sulfur domain-containing protein [Actinomycetes bacterium]|nr:CDGSH iron-sulfur domain-containing protein [Acidimicrobiia bacterium]